MLARQRHRVILEMLETQQSLRTIELAKYFDVTDETIRRDLETLDANGKLFRTHGGAVRLKPRGVDLPLQSRLQENRGAKLEIAKKALNLIKPNDTILLDASSSVLALAELIPDFDLTVITNSYDCVSALMNKEHIKIILTGGVFDKISHSLGGAIAWATLRRFAIDKIFFSCNGIDADRGVSEAVDFHAEFKENALALCTEKILLCDSSKFGVRSSRFFAAIDEFDKIITNSDADEVFLQKLKDKALTVL